MSIPHNKKIVGVIPARMQSTRFPGKPLAKILGKEMIKWVYEMATQSKVLKDIVVAIDHPQIEEYCKKEKMRYMMTSPEHKNCSERSNEVCRRSGADFVVEIQGDEPTLLPSDLDEFVTKAFEHPKFDIVTQYTDLTLEQARDVHNVKLIVGRNQRALFFSRCPIPLNFKTNDVKYYKQIGLFLWHAEAIRRFSQLPKTDLEKAEDTHMLRLVEHEFDIYLVYTPQYTVGVDVPEDIPQAEEFLLRRTKSK